MGSKELLLGLFSLLFCGAGLLAQRIYPEDLIYRGAFRLPDVEPYEYSWNYGGSAMTYYPDGDESGPADGYPGSIFGVGHDWNMYVSEITIPVPVVSEIKSVDDLNTAETLQSFQNVRGDLFRDSKGDELFYEIIRVGMQYLPPQGMQTTGKLHFVWGQHFQEERQDPSHMWCEVNLSDPRPRGGWYFGTYTNYVTNDYIFDIPEEWADEHAPGHRLATGRFRDGGWSGQGPALFAYSPWQNDNPSRENDTITQIVPLLLFGIQEEGSRYITCHDSMMMNGYKEADEWSGGAWLTSGGRSAVIFVGTKGIGECWYGLADGTVWPDSPPYPEDPLNQRGWWCEKFEGQIIFYDPGDLAAVVEGEISSYDPQPYAVLNIDPYLFSVDSSQQKSHVGAACFDRERGLLYIFELFADGEKPIVHVWQIEGDSDVDQNKKSSSEYKILKTYPNPFNSEIMIEYNLETEAEIEIAIYDVNGCEEIELASGIKSSGTYSIRWNGKDKSKRQVSSGIHLCILKGRERGSGRGSFIIVKKLIFLK